MVHLTEHIQSPGAEHCQRDAHRALMRLGVRAPYRPETDYRQVIFALDELGTMARRATSQRAFLVSPNRSLHGQLPADVLAERHGAARVVRAIHAQTDASRT